MPLSHHHATEPTILMVPGIDNSGPGHWQSLWEAEDPRIVRAELGMWNRPRRNVWVTNLGHAIRQLTAPVVLCAHSLGCLAVAWWAALERQRSNHPVAAALLVAPPDCDWPDQDSRLADFAPSPEVQLPFPALLVASRNDPYADIDSAWRMAAQWGANFLDAGELGHINADSNLGRWPTGRALLARMVDIAKLSLPVGRSKFTVEPRSSPRETGQPDWSRATFARKRPAHRP